jgi:cysteine desulfurase/selenocysteine lyase
LARHGRVYLDSTAMAQMPHSVRRSIFDYFKENLRGSNHSEHSSEAREAQAKVDETRRKLRDFFGARNYHVCFNSGTTASSNFVGLNFPFESRDLLLLTHMEHNSQVATVRQNAEKAGARIQFIPVDSEGRLDLNQLRQVAYNHRNLAGKVLMNIVHVSNVTGIVNPVQEVKGILNRYFGDRAFLYLDMAQSSGHIPINLNELGADAAATSAYKMFGPTGMGALFANDRICDVLHNRVSGGGAVKLVTEQGFIPEDMPGRFEPGTQNIEGIIGWGFTLDYLANIGMDKIEKYDTSLGRHFLEGLLRIPNVEVYGPRDFKDRTAIIPFNVGGRRNYGRVAKTLDKFGVSVRDGCFCAHFYVPRLLGVSGSVVQDKFSLIASGKKRDEVELEGAVRASFSFYNNKNDANRALNAIREIANGN